MRRKKRTLLSLVALILGVSPALPATPPCSLRVHVVTPSGVRIAAPVTVRERDGRLTTIDEYEGDAEFCDLGIVPVEVTVGRTTMCNSVTVADVPVRWNQSYTLTITYDPMACGEEPPPPPVPVCEIVLHVYNRGGAPIPGARISLISPARVTLVADTYGRALRVVRTGATLRGTVTAPGHEARPFSFLCGPNQTAREERLHLNDSQ